MIMSSFPRTRGGDPIDEGSGDRYHQFSPHARG